MGEFIVSNTVLHKLSVMCKSSVLLGGGGSPFPFVSSFLDVMWKGKNGSFFFFFFLKFLLWWGETTQYTNWGHYIWWTNLVSLVKTPIAIHLLRVTSWFGSNKPWEKVDNLGNGVRALFVAAVAGWVPRKMGSSSCCLLNCVQKEKPWERLDPFFQQETAWLLPAFDFYWGD